MSDLSRYKDLKVRWTRSEPYLGYAQGKIFSLDHYYDKYEQKIRYILRIYTTRKMYLAEEYLFQLGMDEISDDYIEMYKHVWGLNEGWDVDNMRKNAAPELLAQKHRENMDLFKLDWYGFILTRESIHSI